MKESYEEGVASHFGPKPCVGDRKGTGEASAGVHAGGVKKPVISKFRELTSIGNDGKQHQSRRYASRASGPGGLHDLRHAWKTFSRESGDPATNCESSSAVRQGRCTKASTPWVYGHGKSDEGIVPTKSSNNAANGATETMEGRPSAKGDPAQQNRSRAQNRQDLQHALTRVREAAIGNRKMRFTSLWHHVYDVDRLRECFLSIKRNAAAGVDGVTWQAYADLLEENLEGLSARLKSGGYRARPVRRTFIPKEDGTRRPLGVTALEDKIVQRAVSEVISAVYEVDFRGFSYGFRPGRSQHNALDALCVGLTQRRVNWVFDADIRGFFDAMSHEWLLKFVEHRIADRRVIRHIQKWLKAGVLTDGEIEHAERGTPQGGSISPLLANIYLHYVFDLWADRWRRHHAHGDVIMVRYADDIVMGFEHEWEARRFMADLRERFAKFDLELHPDKTRLIEFGRYAASARRARGAGKPETFDFLGFTHICGRRRNGGFKVLRLTMRKRFTRTLRAIRAALTRRMHRPIAETGRWLLSVVRGWYGYYAVPGNSRSLVNFCYLVTRTWREILGKRSQKARLTWTQLGPLMHRYVPNSRILHPYPEVRFRCLTQGRSPVR